MEVKVAKIVEAEECTKDFIKEGEKFTSAYIICKMRKNKYAFVHKTSREVFVVFESVEKITEKVWLLNINKKEKRLIDISEFIPKMTYEFSKVIKVFEEYMLVELKDGDRSLLEFSEIDTNSSTIFQGPYRVFELPNGKYTIMDMDNLSVANFEFDLSWQNFN